MDLVGRLSNHDLTTLLHRLTTCDWKQARREQHGAGGVAPDGRRRFGSVSDAIVEALIAAGSDGLRATEIHAVVQAKLGGEVSPSSIKNHLAKNCHGAGARFERVAWGRYRFADGKPDRASRSGAGRHTGTPADQGRQAQACPDGSS